MIKSGILNPTVLSLLARVRHTNTLVISDRGFPFWSEIETIDLSLVDDVPTVTQVLEAVLPNFNVGKAWMAQEFVESNPAEVMDRYQTLLGNVKIAHEAHPTFKKRVPQAIGLIRTGDTTQYANLILESA